MTENQSNDALGQLFGWLENNQECRTDPRFHAYLGQLREQESPALAAALLLQDLSLGLLELIRRRQAEQDAEAPDVLTGLQRRGPLLKRLKETIGQGSLYLLCLDIQGMRAFNGEYDMTAGDRLLLALGEHLRKRLAIECLYRKASEEFVVVIGPDSQVDELIPDLIFDPAAGRARAVPRGSEAEGVRVPVRWAVLEIHSDFKGDDAKAYAWRELAEELVPILLDKAMIQAEVGGIRQVYRLNPETLRGFSL